MTGNPEAVDVTVPERALAGVQVELQRVDSKANTLLTLAGAGLALTSSATPYAHLAPRLLFGAGIAVLVAAIVVILAVIRPRLPGLSGFDAHARDDLHTVTADLLGADPARWLAREVWVLSGIARRKYIRLRTGCLLLTGAAVLIAAATVTNSALSG